MTWASRIKLLVGLIGVTALVGAFTYVFDQRQSEAPSTSAEISADSYTVGTDYGGTVTRQYVRVGQKVHAGQPLFQVRSLSLLQELSRNPVSFSTATYTVHRDGTMTFKATTAGTVGTIDTKANDYVQPGEDLATISKAGSLFVDAEFVLTPREYEQLRAGQSADVVLPDRTVLHGTVRSIQVTTKNGQAQARVHISSPDLAIGADATVHTEHAGVLASVENSTFDFVRRIGL
jgi:multidrug resistance efflux pump